MRLAMTLAMVLAPTLFSSERMNVSVCNLGHLPASLVAQAEVEAALVFRSIGVEVVWANCQDEVATEQAERGLRFMIRLRDDKPPKTAGLASLDAMGRSYVSKPGDGNMADVYYRAVQEFSAQHGADADGLLGSVIAHELGHLLLGPGHASHGIMRAPWNTGDATAAKQRSLKFTSAQQEEIYRNLEVRNAVQPDPK
jgi:hypothetical protein